MATPTVRIFQNCRKITYKILDAIIEYVKMAYQGLHGFVFDDRGNALEDATIEVAEINKPVHTDVNGDFWRPLLAGDYQVTASMLGYQSAFVEVRIFFDF